VSKGEELNEKLPSGGKEAAKAKDDKIYLVRI
jgi:hypothetical protein